MAWVKIGDDIYDNPKFAVVGPLGLALYVAIIAHCNRNQTDGYIGKGKARLLLDFDGITVSGKTGDAAARQVLSVMVESGLLHVSGHGCAECLSREDGGQPKAVEYLVHDYLNHQASRAEIKAKAEATRKRVAMYRKKKQVSNGGGNALHSEDVTVGVTQAVTVLKKEEVRSKKGGEGNVSATPAGDRPRPHCSKHAENHDGPCRPCQRRREWDEAHAVSAAQSEIEQRRLLKEIRRSCPHCDENGMMETADGMVRCTEHREAVL